MHNIHSRDIMINRILKEKGGHYSVLRLLSQEELIKEYFRKREKA